MAERLTGSEKNNDREKLVAELEAVKKSPEYTAEKSPDNTKERKAKARETIDRASEKLKDKQSVEGQNDHPEKKKPERKYSKRERRQIFNKEMKKVQKQLPPASRALSKVVHNRVVENVSEVLEETVLRPSVLIGGAIVGLLGGGLFYVFARMQGFPLSGSEFVISMLAGALIGVVLEIIYKWFKHS